MSVIGTEADALVRWSDAERLSALKRIIPKRSVTSVLRKTGKDSTFCKRLPAWVVVWFMAGIGLFNADSYRQVYRWLMQSSKNRPVPIRSTICEARKRLGARAMALLHGQVVKLLANAGEMPSAFYRGMRLMALDGFTLNVPDTPANDQAFGRPGTRRAPGAFPQVRVLALCEACTHTLWKALVKHYRCGEITMTPHLLKHLQAGMLLMWDRNFFSYAHVQQVVSRGAHLLAPVKSHLILRPIRKLRDGSYLTKIYASTYDRAQDRNGIVVRIIKYSLNDPGRHHHGEVRRLLTTLLDEKLDPARTLVELYHVRWEQELSIDELKTHEMERPVLRSQTPAGVIQEIYGLLLTHYVVRKLMYEAAVLASTREKPLTPLGLSFTGTLKILRCRLGAVPKTARGQRKWYQDLLEEIGGETIEPRRNRSNPRVIKRKMSNWKKKRPEHRNYPQPTKEFRKSIVVLR
jgi:hypothetical protein